VSGAHRPASFDTIQLPAGSAALVLAPHPDDFDAIGMTMRLLHGRGHAIHLAVATSGASGVDDAFCRPATAAAKAALREQEQRESCAVFGLPEERLRFLRLPEDDGGHALVDAVNTARVAALLREVRPAAVFLPHRRDTSVGHQRTYALLCAAVGVLAVPSGAAPAVVPGAAGSIAALPFAAFLNRDPKTVAMRYDVVTPYGKEEAAWKAELLRSHRSQQERNLRSRGRGFDERILEMDRDTAAACDLSAPYAEAFEVERFDTPPVAA
jgi:LmbE family N-acetylglucosaminyl deacetylase